MFWPPTLRFHWRNRSGELNQRPQPSEPAFPDQNAKRHAQGPAGDTLALPFEQDLSPLDPFGSGQAAVGAKQDPVDRTFRNQGMVTPGTLPDGNVTAVDRRQ